MVRIRKAFGFTLLEVMVVVLLLGLLTLVALPRYSTYTTRAAYAEVVLAAQVYKNAVEVCAVTNPMTACDAGVNGIPRSQSSQAVMGVTVEDGLVTVTPKDYRGLTAANVYTLTPTGGGDGAQVMVWTDNCHENEFC